MKTRLVLKEHAFWNPDWKVDTLLIFDRRLLKEHASRAWIERFPVRYGVEAGESLKDLQKFPAHMAEISKKAGSLSSRRLRIVVAGGGSVGDFGGFVASIFKRGVRLVHVPTTWLAALDSAHGGKTGLNVGGAKNQVGTFYPAESVYLFREFLLTQPRARAIEAMAEALKMLCLKGPSVLRGEFDPHHPEKCLWQNLPALIRAKNSIVQKDPQEKSGLRHLLNLGHTYGHVIEAELKYPHGLAVAYGLIFALIYSRHRRDMTDAALAAIFRHPAWSFFLPSVSHLESLSIAPTRIRQLLLKDKKRTREEALRFIFLKKMQQPMIREVSVEELVLEVQRQKKLVKLTYG